MGFPKLLLVLCKSHEWRRRQTGILTPNPLPFVALPVIGCLFGLSREFLIKLLIKNVHKFVEENPEERNKRFAMIVGHCGIFFCRIRLLFLARWILQYVL